MVAPTYIQDKRIKIINEDAFEFKPPKDKRYDFVWHDIWDDICTDNLPEMTKLHRKYVKKHRGKTIGVNGNAKKDKDRI